MSVVSERELKIMIEKLVEPEEIIFEYDDKIEKLEVLLWN